MAASRLLSTWRGYLLVQVACVLMIFTVGNSAALEIGTESTETTSHHGYQGLTVNCEHHYARRGEIRSSGHIQSIKAIFGESYSQAWRSVSKDAECGDDAVVIVSTGRTAQYITIQDHRLLDNDTRTSMRITSGVYDEEEVAVPSTSIPCCSISETSNTSCTNLNLDFGQSYVRTAQSTNLEGADTMLSICCERASDPSVVKQFASMTDPCTLTWHNFAVMDGTWPVLPGLAQSGEDSRSYEPRARPWFRTVSSGVKVVVVPLNSAASMNNNFPPDLGGNTLLEAAKDIATHLLSTLSAGDHVNMIVFNSTRATPLAASAILVQDYNTTEQVELDPLKLQLSSLTVQTQFKQSDLSGVILAALPNFNSNPKTACKVILVITDGVLAALGNTKFLSANLTGVKLVLYKLKWPDDPDPFLSNNTLIRPVYAVGCHFEPIWKNVENFHLALHKLLSYLVNLKRTSTGGSPQDSFAHQDFEQIGGNFTVVTKPAFLGNDIGGIAGVTIYMDLFRSLTDAVCRALTSKIQGSRVPTAKVVLAALLPITA